MRWIARAVVALLLATSLAACGDGGGPEGGGPTRSPTIELPTPTRTDATEDTGQAEPSETPTEEPEPTDRPAPSDRSPGGASEQPSEETSQEPSEESSQEPSEESSESADASAEEADDEGTPTWLWWLLAAVVLGAIIAIPLLLRARRRTAWRRQLSEAEGELGWLARELLPGLRRVGSREQVAGGWAVALPRVTAAEDRLTVLESSAYDEGGRNRARALRDASRLARARMGQLVEPGAHDTWALDLDAIMADVEAALGPARTTPA